MYTNCTSIFGPFQNKCSDKNDSEKYGSSCKQILNSIKLYLKLTVLTRLMAKFLTWVIDHLQTSRWSSSSHSFTDPRPVELLFVSLLRLSFSAMKLGRLKRKCHGFLQHLSSHAY